LLSTGTRLVASVAPRAAAEIAGLYSEALSLGADIVELRLDAMGRPDGAAISEALRSPGISCDRLLLTYRSPEEGGLGPLPLHDPAVAALVGDLWRGCSGSLVDLEVEALSRSERLRELAREAVNHSVISKHYNSTPTIDAAERDYARMSGAGRYVKMVFRASSPLDNLLPIALQRASGRGRLIAFCSGHAGLLSRVMSAVLGAPLAYVSLPSRPLAEGQMGPAEFAALVDGVSSALGPAHRERGRAP
jgi:3-dehydroquinate dehydratase type I